MSSYFKGLPTVKYRNRYAPNILLMLKLSYDVLESSEIYHPFVISDGDRPDTIADLYYQDPESDWLIYLANNIINIHDEWPLSNTLLEKTIVKKYGSHTKAAEIKQYNLKRDIPSIQQAQFDNLSNEMKRYWSYDYNYKTYNIVDLDVIISPTAWLNLPLGERIYWEPVTFYDYEFQKNERKRRIRLIDKKYKTTLEEALRNVLNE